MTILQETKKLEIFFQSGKKIRIFFPLTVTTGQGSFKPQATVIPRLLPCEFCYCSVVQSVLPGVRGVTSARIAHSITGSG